jgi:hypothetical protein
MPDLDLWLDEARAANPDVPEPALRSYYVQKYGGANTFPSWESWLPDARTANPQVPEDALRTYWEEKYPGAPEKDTHLGFTGTLKEGAKSAGRSLLATGQALIGDEAGVVETTQAQHAAPKDTALEALLADIQRRKEELGNDPSWLSTAKALGQAAITHPKGTGLLLTEQLPNSAVALGTAGAGAVIGGAIGGPPGAIIGGIAGLFLANTGLETGSKVMEAAGDQSFTPEERSEALTEGAIKGGVVTALDVATLGATNWLAGTTARAIERATVKTLTDAGVDVTDKAALAAARQNPDLVQKVTDSATRAKAAVNTLGRRLGRGAGEFASESIGEGAGEYLGEYAATGQGDKVEALIEAFAGLGQSAAEIAVVQAHQRGLEALLPRPAEPPMPPAIQQPMTEVGVTDAGVGVDQAIQRMFDLSNTPSEAGKEATKQYLEKVTTDFNERKAVADLEAADEAAQEEAALRENLQAINQGQVEPETPLPRVGAETPILPGAEPQSAIQPTPGVDQAIGQVTGATPTPAAKSGAESLMQAAAADRLVQPVTTYQGRRETEPDAKAGLAAERAKLLAMKEYRPDPALGIETTFQGAQVAGAQPSPYAMSQLKQRLADARPKAPEITPPLPGPTLTDQRANEAATSPENDRPEPTEGQKDAGNYQKGHIRISGLDVSIENPAGSVRSGTDPSGQPWSVTMQSHYGYIRGTVGKDKDHIDLLIKPGTPTDYSGLVFVVDQKNPATGAFDEHKTVFGAATRAEAKSLYLANYAKDWKGYRSMRAFTMKEFQLWLKTGNHKRPVMPFAEKETPTKVEPPTAPPPTGQPQPPAQPPVTPPATPEPPKAEPPKAEPPKAEPPKPAPVSTGNADLDRLGASSSSDLIGKSVKPTADSGLNIAKNAGKVTHVVTDSGGRVKVRINGTGPHWYASDFELDGEQAPAEEPETPTKKQPHQPSDLKEGDRVKWFSGRVGESRELTGTVAYTPNYAKDAKYVHVKVDSAKQDHYQDLPLGAMGPGIVRLPPEVKKSESVDTLKQPQSEDTLKPAPKGDTINTGPIKLVDESKEDELIKRIKDRMKGLHANPMFDPRLMADAIQLGAIYLQKGANNFIAWSQQMIQILGKGIKPYLRPAWSALKAIPKDQPIKPNALQSFLIFGKTAWDKGTTDYDAFTAALTKGFGKMVTPYADAIHAATDAFHNATEEDETKTPKTEEEKVAAAIEVAEQVKEHLEMAAVHGRAITREDLFQWADDAFEGTQGSGAYTPKEAFDALELGINRYIQAERQLFNPSGHDSAAHAVNTVDRIRRRITERIPSQAGLRTDEMNEFQQFSTPPDLAYAMNWVANLEEDDRVIEPSAGLGGLAVFANNAPGVEVVVNELNKRRFELLKALNILHTTNENAEQINNIWKGPKPTVVIMNPPFSSTAGRIEGQRKSINVIQHIDQALKLLPEGGRLVVLIGDHDMGRDRDNSIHGKTSLSEGVLLALNNLPAQMQASIRLSGKGYAKYGTTYGNRLLVYDKIAKTGTPPVTGFFEDIKDALPVLLEVRNARPTLARSTEQPTTQPGSDSLDQPGTGGTRPELPSDVSTPPVGPGTGGAQVDTGGGGPGTLPQLPGGRSDTEKPGGGVSLPGGRPTTGPRGATPGTGGPRGTEGPTGGSLQTPGVLGGGADSGSKSGAELPTNEPTGLNVESSLDAKATDEISDSLYETYTPQKLKIPGAQPHPGKLVQSAALATTEPPDPTYTPNLPKELITSGALSLAQLEAIVYAGQSHQHLLPNGERQGFFIGDGTGVGKGREIGGIILDNMRQGRKKHIWISEKENLLASALRDWKNLKQKEDLFMDGGAADGKKPLPNKDGVLFTRYSMLASGSTILNGQLVRKDVKPKAGQKTTGEKMNSRLEQLIAWAGPDFDGVIAFDESHNMTNTDGEANARGASPPAARAMAANELQRRLPKARIVYVSATGAKSVSTLVYTERLGLWGEGTPFPKKVDFVGKITQGGLGAMEMVTRDLKADGKYIARSLAYDSVTYDQLEHELTIDQSEIYDNMAQAWQVVLQNLNEALKDTGVVGEDRFGNTKTRNGNAKGKLIGAFWSAQQRFFQQVLNALMMPTTLKAMEKAIADGHSVVVQLVNTYESGQKRELDRIKAEGADLESMDLTPRKDLIEYLKKSFPVQQFEQYSDDGGKTIKSRPVESSDGKPVLNAEAVKRRDALIEKIADPKFAVPDSPIDQMLHALGHKNVAEVTGRSERVVRPEDGRAYTEKRSPTIRNMEVQQFKDDKRKALIFSNAGGTGESYDADRTFKNQRRRYHFVTQPGWSATTVIQGLGRTHRSNEANSPHVILTMTNVKGHRRFISTVAKGLDALGAITQGQRQTGSSGLIDAKNNLENSYGTAAVVSLMNDLARGQVKTIPDNMGALTKMGLNDIVDGSTGMIIDDKMPTVQRFLNRVMVLVIEEQNVMFDEFYSRLEAGVEAAAANGTLDVGMETYRADGGIEVLDEQIVRTDERSGAKTIWTTLRAKHKVQFAPFEDVLRGRFLKGIMGFYRNNQSGKIWAAERSFQRTAKDGRIVQMLRLQGPVANQMQNIEEPAIYGFTKVSEADGQVYWEQTIKNHPAYRTDDLDMVSGSLMKVWDRLPSTHNRIMRLQTTDGRRYLGRIILKSDVDETKKKLGLGRSKITDSPEELVRKMVEEGDKLHLANGWKIKPVNIGGEQRLELTGPELYNNRDSLQKYGVFWEVRNGTTRYWIPNTEEKAVEVLKQLIRYHEVVQIEPGAGYTASPESAYGDEEDNQDELAARLDTTKDKKKSARQEAIDTMVDVGEKIGGARKDLWASRGLTLDDLKDMTGGEEAKYVTKQNVWRPDYADMVKNGTEPMAAALIKVFYDRLGAKPRNDTPEGRRAFVATMQKVRASLEGIKKADELKPNKIFDWTDAATYEERRSVMQANKYSFSWGWDYTDRRRAERLVAAGFPNTEPWQRKYEVRTILEPLRPEAGTEERETHAEQAARYAKRLTQMFANWPERFLPKVTTEAGAALAMRAGGIYQVYRKSGGGRMEVVAYAGREEHAETLAKQLYEQSKAAGEDGDKMPVRPHLDKLIREGAPQREGNVTAQDFLEAFGFRGVEFGNWAASDERQKHVNQAYDALADLADVLGIPARAISLDGTLGLAFGARGSGSAAAHYEPAKLVINITKINGPGALAHEWGHALDHYFGEVDSPSPYSSSPKSVSGWREKPRHYANRLTNLRPEMRQAFEKVMYALYNRNKTKADEVRELELRLENEQKDLAAKKASVARIYADPELLKVNKRYIDWVTMMIPRLEERTIPNTQAELATAREEPEKAGGYGSVTSSYSEAADKLSGPSGDYWKRPTELFARSFEAYVQDKLGRKSQYLVHGTDVFSSGYKANPYPAGVERQQIAAAYDTVFENILFTPTDRGMKLYEPESDAYDVRENESATQNKALAQAALNDLENPGELTSQTNELPVKTHGIGISAHLIKTGVIDLTGQTVKTANDLALLAQVYRDPRFETTRFFYLKGNQIVAHEGVTSRLPGLVKVFDGPDDQARKVELMKQRMAALGADGYWLMHNHPSGSSAPSWQDINFTDFIEKAVPGFRGHIVIDSNEYTVIREEGRTTRVAWDGPDPLLEPSMPNPLLGSLINAKEDVVALGHKIQSGPEYATVLYRSSNGKTRAIQEVPISLLEDVERATTYLQEQAVAFGASRIFSHYKGTRIHWDPLIESMSELIQRGVVYDHVGEWLDSTGYKPYSYREDQKLEARPLMMLGKNLWTLKGEAVAEPEAPTSPAFTRWFGDSKVVNPDGSPKVVYHGTDTPGFKRFHRSGSGNFGPGMYFTESAIDAEEYINTLGDSHAGIYPVYLKIENPYYPDSDEDYDGQDIGNELMNRLKAQGYDGIIDEVSEGPVHYVVFDATQIKSASGNNGRFNPKNPSIVNESQADYGTTTAQPTTIKAPLPSVTPERLNYAMPAMSNLDDVIRLLQDKNIDMVRLVDAVRDAGAEISDDLNPVLKEEMYMGRVSQRLQNFLTDELKPLLQQMRLNRVSLDDFDEYLHARHAEEANRHLATINPDLEDNEALSGMDNATAAKILERAPAVMGKLAAKVDDILRTSRSLMVDYGLESQDTVDKWADQYSFYVPLKRAGFEDELPGTGQGRNIRGSHVKRRLGSTRSVIDILANVALDREKVLVRGEKMRPVIALAGLLMRHPNKEIATLTKPVSVSYMDPETGLLIAATGQTGPYRVPMMKVLGADGTVKWVPDPTYKGRPNIVTFRINGKDHSILFNESNPRAMAIAHALKDLDVGQLNTVMSAAARVTRYIASINTQYNPIFGVVNFVRDVQFAMLALSSTPLAGKKSEVWAATWQAIRGIYSDARAIRRGEHPTSPTAQLWERFQNVGGPTGYRDMYRTSGDRAEAIRQLLDPDWWQKTKAGKVLTAGGHLAAVESRAVDFVRRNVFEWLSDYNQTMENAVRLGVFKAGLDQGLSDEQAASLAKNITVNFNKKGQISAQAGALFAFFNASVQGSARVFQTLFDGKMRLTPVGLKIVVGGATLGALQAFALAMAGFDDDQPPEWLKERSLVIPVPGTEKGYVSIPMPLGFNILPNLGRMAGETLVYGKPAQQGYNFLASLVNTFSPVGGAGSVGQFIAPTAADPLIALGENKDWTGRQIYKEDFNKLHPTPGFTRSRATASPWARGMAELVNYATGGTDYTPGAFSPTPDQIDYLIGQATGGIGRETAKAFQTAESVVTGEDLPLYKVPGVGRFIGSASDQTAVRDEFYQNLTRMNTLEAEVKGRRQHGEDIRGFVQDNPDARLARYAGQVEREVQQLQHQKRELLRRGAPAERVQLVEMKIRTRMAQLNDRVRSLTR